MFSIWPNISNNGLCNNFKQCLLLHNNLIIKCDIIVTQFLTRHSSPCLLEFVLNQCLVPFCVVYVDGVWHGDFAQHQAPVFRLTNRGSGSDSSSNVAGQGPLPALGLLPAVRELFLSDLLRNTKKMKNQAAPSLRGHQARKKVCRVSW